jgi:hypothetical protein
MVLTPANNWAHSGKALGAFSCVKIEASLVLIRLLWG